ncbi:DUF732 domain-containing protein [Streptomyces sp. NPDC058691]|uniref:DUF732 domain-containing protein n=1 Tax=Streptomyces sp. NPDC058691 TaxID=3346601 RepID=UPI003667E19B
MAVIRDCRAMRILRLASAATLLITVCACAGSTTRTEPATSRATVSEEVLADAAAGGSIPSDLGPAHRDAYLRAIGDIDPALDSRGMDPALWAGRDICVLLAADVSRGTVIARTVERFSTSDRRVAAAEAGRIVRAAHRFICPDLPRKAG